MFVTSRLKLLSLRGAIAAMVIAFSGLTIPATASAQLSGAIFTTSFDGTACSGTDLNIYASRQDVYLDGGPHHTGAAGLPDGNYYVKVTDPSGADRLGYTTTASVVVSGGEFVTCYQLWAILVKDSDGTQGYDLTPNNGGEYKVWVSTVSNFDNSSTKTDNFKVDEDGGGGVVSTGTLVVQKFYDANANSVVDGSDTFIIGWKVAIADDATAPATCINQDDFTEVVSVVQPGVCVVKEYMPTQTNWIRTLPAGTDTIVVNVPENGTGTALFGNVCTGPGGGHTLGFWSNRNGQALTSEADLQALAALNLRNADGSPFDPTTLAGFRSWLLSGSATNMAYMLSVQLAAMELNVYEGFVSGSALIYAPGTASANANGFATVNDVMAEANAELGADGQTLSGDPNRAIQEALKNALDKANNNLNFVQSSPCAFTFN
ncbi:MAG: hypothetical protein NDJ19_00860 [Ramlibacter sp.]|nr:hypothetical protein [Ramlibacter sp.]